MLNGSLRRLKSIPSKVCALREFTNLIHKQGYARNASYFPRHLDDLNKTAVLPINDVHVATQQLDGDASAVSVFVRSGSAFESNHPRGVANLLRAVLTNVCFARCCTFLPSRISPRRLASWAPQSRAAPGASTPSTRCSA
jgi:hypothetical protein